MAIPPAALAAMAQFPAAAHDRGSMFTTVAHYTDPIEAHLARGRLLSEGIDAHLGDEHLAMANWEWRLAVGGVKLRVADRDAERARAVLNAMDAGEYALAADSDEQRESTEARHVGETQDRPGRSRECEDTAKKK